jgi:hypothetical protein
VEDRPGEPLAHAVHEVWPAPERPSRRSGRQHDLVCGEVLEAVRDGLQGIRRAGSAVRLDAGRAQPCEAGFEARFPAEDEDFRVAALHARHHHLVQRLLAGGVVRDH